MQEIFMHGAGPPAQRKLPHTQEKTMKTNATKTQFTGELHGTKEASKKRYRS